MKIVSKPIDAIVVFKKKEIPIPYKFKYTENEYDEVKEVKVGKIVTAERKRIAGVETIIYRCQSEISGRTITYELKYIIAECRWVLYKL